MLSGLAIDVARLALWLAILAAIFVPLERVFALRPNTERRGQVLSDLGFYFVSGLIPALLLGVPMAIVARGAHAVMPSAYYGWIDALPLWTRMAAAFVIAELGFYWGHRLAHAIPFIWRYHALHHRPVRLDWLVNTRAHPVDLVFVRLFGLTPIYILGLARPDAGAGSGIAILIVLISTIWGFFIHANMRWRLGPIEHLVSSPRFHHWHHNLDGPIDRNFASTLPPLDRLFGTLHLPPGAWPERYGVTDDARIAREATPAE